MNECPHCEKYHCGVFDHDSCLEGSWSWRKEAKKKKMKSEIRRLGIERKERRKEKWMKSRTKRRSAQAFGGISGSSFARICSMSTAHYFMIMSKLSSLTSI